MKLNIDLSELYTSVKQMGAETIPFSLDNVNFQSTDIDEILGTIGFSIDLEELEYNEGLLGYKGRQVLLYIPDHANRISSVLENGVKGNKYHVADCETLNTMKEKKRFDRYVVTNDVSGEFKISGIDYETREELTGVSSLNICKNCLKYLNYQNYKVSTNVDKSRIFNQFELMTFFESYSTLFQHFPKMKNKIYSANYTKDWKVVSDSYKNDKRYICESCNTSFEEDKQFLHTHHINGVKDDNRNTNLKAVCIDCHRKEPNHTHLNLKYEEMIKINRIRRNQNKLLINTWDDVFKFSDLSLHGYLNLLKKQKPTLIPDIGCFKSIDGKEIYFDVVWHNIKRAVILNPINRKIIDNRLGYICLSLNDALKKIK